MAGISMPQRRQKEEKEDPLDKVLKGLQVAGSVFGIYSDLTNISARKDESARAAEVAERQKKEFATKTQDRTIGERNIIFEPDLRDLGGKGFEVTQTTPAQDPSVLEVTVRRMTSDGKPTDRRVFLKTPKIVGFQQTKELNQIKSKEEKERDEEKARRADKATKDRNDWSLKLLDRREKLAKELAAVRNSGEKGRLTDSETNSATFAQRAYDANDVFDKLVDEGFSRSDITTAIADFVLPEAIIPEDLERQNQAERDFLTAVLRKESGASISSSEFEMGANVYFPRAGNSAKTLEQKQKSRINAIQGLIRGAGRAKGDLQTQPTAPKAGAAQAAPLPAASSVAPTNAATPPLYKPKPKR